ncbi:MAG TPA: dihydrodipicolinate synthase family protein [Candidatus Cottocaccamicrobium excrementipullorum]|nr:dihydrodipicolinate synthase family protein [Candidatus Cottocaccamicrobium excrementipullorum]
MEDRFPNGEYPVMLTPFTDKNEVDYEALEKLVDWYIQNGVAGLFADCQSSEMFYLTLKERVEIAKAVKKFAAGRVPVVASGHISDRLEDQVEELTAIAETGVDAVILLTNRLAKKESSEEEWLEHLKELLSRLPGEIPLGFYECPYPYKRIISVENLKWCADSGRFYFIKDTSCDLQCIKGKMEVIKGSQLKLYNANTSTLLESLNMGAAGFSGVMANFHPQLYAWLCRNFDRQPERARLLADFLTVASLIERQVYPVNAKYYQKMVGNFNSIQTRSKDAGLLNETGMLEVEQLARLQDYFIELYSR